MTGINERQHGGQAIERLDGRLLVGREHRRVIRRIQIPSNHVGGLRLPGALLVAPSWAAHGLTGTEPTKDVCTGADCEQGHPTRAGLNNMPFISFSR